MKYIVIQSCLGCPHITVDDTLDKYYCYNLKKIVDGEAADIPKWCPLEELEKTKENRE